MSWHIYSVPCDSDSDSDRDDIYGDGNDIDSAHDNETDDKDGDDDDFQETSRSSFSKPEARGTKNYSGLRIQLSINQIEVNVRVFSITQAWESWKKDKCITGKSEQKQKEVRKKEANVQKEDEQKRSILEEKLYYKGDYILQNEKEEWLKSSAVFWQSQQSVFPFL